MSGGDRVYCDNAEIFAFARLVIALDAFDRVLPPMADSSWEAYEDVQDATTAARDALIAVGYAHLLAGHVA